MLLQKRPVNDPVGFLVGQDQGFVFLFEVISRVASGNHANGKNTHEAQQRSPQAGKSLQDTTGGQQRQKR